MVIITLSTSGKHQYKHEDVHFIENFKVQLRTLHPRAN